MSARMETFGSREEWLKARTRIGGSEISSVIGISPWMSNVELWELKTGRRKHKEDSGNAFTKYGSKAEEHIRELFALDFPEYEVFYEPNNLWTNSRYPFAGSSLDGWLKDKKGRFGVLEIKTALISNSRAADKWKGRIPDYYFAQLIWSMTVTEADFGILVAQLKYEREDDMYKIIRHYRTEMKGNEGSRDYLLEEAMRFWRCVEEDKAPALKLPEL